MKENGVLSAPRILSSGAIVTSQPWTQLTGGYARWINGGHSIKNIEAHQKCQQNILHVDFEIIDRYSMAIPIATIFNSLSVNTKFASEIAHPCSYTYANDKPSEM